MKTHQLLTWGGVALVILGIILIKSVYNYYYPGDLARTLTDPWPAYLCLLGGGIMSLAGIRIKDGEQ